VLLARQPELIRRRQTNESSPPIAGRGLFFRYWLIELMDELVRDSNVDRSTA
jgi:hypothetical protein